VARTSFPDGIDAAAMTAGDPRRIIALRFLTFAIIIGIAMMGLLGGGRPVDRSAKNAQASFVVTSHERLRNGNYFEIRFHATAHQPIADAVIALPAAMLRETTVNSLVPEPREEAYEDGEYRFRLGSLAAGQTLRFKLDGQLNPMLFGAVEGEYRLLDGKRELARVPATFEVLP
jgi:hypothetical protein